MHCETRQGVEAHDTKPRRGSAINLMNAILNIFSFNKEHQPFRGYKAIKILTGALLIAITAALVSFTVPNGWVKNETTPGMYGAGIDKGAGQNGINAATIKSLVEDIIGDFGFPWSKF